MYIKRVRKSNPNSKRENVKEQNQIQPRHLRLCSQAEPEHRQIYQRPNLKEVALPRKIAAVK